MSRLFTNREVNQQRAEAVAKQPKLFAIKEKSTGALVTEGDLSNAPSAVPFIKDEASKKELQLTLDSMGPGYEIVAVSVSVA